MVPVIYAPEAERDLDGISGLPGVHQRVSFSSPLTSMRVFFSAEEMEGNVWFVPDDPAVVARWNVK